MYLFLGFGEYARLTDEEVKEYQSLTRKLSKIQFRMMELERRTHPICVIINNDYLNKGINNGVISGFSWSSDGEHMATIGKYKDMIAIFDGSVDTYKYVFRD